MEVLQQENRKLYRYIDALEDTCRLTTELMKKPDTDDAGTQVRMGVGVRDASTQTGGGAVGDMRAQKEALYLSPQPQPKTQLAKLFMCLAPLMRLAAARLPVVHMGANMSTMQLQSDGPLPLKAREGAHIMGTVPYSRQPPCEAPLLLLHMRWVRSLWSALAGVASTLLLRKLQPYARGTYEYLGAVTCDAPVLSLTVQFAFESDMTVLPLRGVRQVASRLQLPGGVSCVMGVAAAETQGANPADFRGDFGAVQDPHLETATDADLATVVSAHLAYNQHVLSSRRDWASVVFQVSANDLVVCMRGAVERVVHDARPLLDCTDSQAAAVVNSVDTFFRKQLATAKRRAASAEHYSIFDSEE